VPELKSVIRDKFPKSKIIYGEHILSRDGKMKYIKPIRLDIYRKMLLWIREYSKDVFVYLCMETRDVWKKVFNLELENEGDLEKLFPQI
jgi:spore photoproduct lyase